MQDIRAELQRETTDIVARLRAFDAMARDSGSDIEDNNTVRDLGDHVQHHTSREMQFITRERLTERLQRLRAAIDRIEHGDYGVCVECGEPISAKRLRAIPEVETCLACQERSERQARLVA